MHRTRVLAIAAISTAVAAGTLAYLARPAPLGYTPAGERREQAPPRISDAEFGELVNVLSEPEGYFDTDNFISNETSYLHVIGRLRDQAETGVYLGVGPGQNFTYIAHAEPSLAIILDIRRQNLLQHLIYKVLIQESDTRVDFLCRLFGRTCPDVDPDRGLVAVLGAIDGAGADSERLEADLEAVPRVLENRYGIALSELDRERLEYVHRSFAAAGLGMRFSSFGRSGAGYPTFSELVSETDSDGEFAAYLADDVLFERVRTLQVENRVLPVVGDFAGTRAFPAVRRLLRDRDLEVSVFYTSNVEFYLFGGPGWNRYLENVNRLPFTSGALFVRAYFPTYGIPHPENVRGHRPTTLLQSVTGFIDDAASGRMDTYWDLVSRNLR